MQKLLFATTLIIFNIAPATANIASWYGPGFHGKRTANGEVFNQNALTAAHKTFTFGTKVRITNRNNGKSAVVCINDRGPYSRDRVIDLSKGAARQIGMLATGTAPVKMEVISKPKSWRYGRKVC